MPCTHISLSNCNYSCCRFTEVKGNAGMYYGNQPNGADFVNVRRIISTGVLFPLELRSTTDKMSKFTYKKFVTHSHYKHGMKYKPDALR